MWMSPHLMRQKTPPGDGGLPHNFAHGYTTFVYGLELLELYNGTKVP